MHCMLDLEISKANVTHGAVCSSHCWIGLQLHQSYDRER